MKSFIDQESIEPLLTIANKPDRGAAQAALAKAGEMKGLASSEVASLMAIDDEATLRQLFDTAKNVKERIYGKRLVLFAPLYISNYCANECRYCAFRAGNNELKRRALTTGEIQREITALVDQGHKRILMVAGESYPAIGFRYVLDSIDAIYSVKHNNGEIRRVNVNVAPLDNEQFKQLKDHKIGTYQVFQETYHRETYAAFHVAGPKKDYDWRVTAMDRAMAAGINDVGIGVLLGLADWRFDVLAMLQHCAHLEAAFGCGPHTISVPRIEPASGSATAAHPPHAVNDDDFRKIIAIVRLAVPSTGIILSTRENAAMRRAGLELGVSQISAGSRTNPGGYTGTDNAYDESQFSLGDHRPLDEVIGDVARLGYIPSFCTGCYRLGRTGADFMDLAKPGEIKTHCDPNGLSTFLEYLDDYALPGTKAKGYKLLEKSLSEMTGIARSRSESLLARVRKGERDVLC